jgi:hypothetical protein
MREIFSGTAQWDKAIAACDEIINSGLYALTADYRDNFKKDNKGSTEFIWVIPYDEVQARGFQLPHMTLHMECQETYKMGGNPGTDGPRCRNSTIPISIQLRIPEPQGDVVGLDPKGTINTGHTGQKTGQFYCRSASLSLMASPH